MKEVVRKRKLIEIALPLEAINTAAAREKSIRFGHPSTLHLWWARRPLAAARAVIFAQMVDDPSSHPEIFPTEEAQEKERQRLFRLIDELVLWANTSNERVLAEAREEIWKSWRITCTENRNHSHARELFDPEKLPAFHDPFAGGGSLPLEAQRLGLKSYASDLNPVAVLINKAMIEIPPKFAGQGPVNPEARSDKVLIERGRRGAQGLAEDVRYYGQWMREEAERQIGHLYPHLEVTAQMARDQADLEPYVGKKLTVISWLWARTVKSPNPAFSHIAVPLIGSTILSTTKGKVVWVDLVIRPDQRGYDFVLRQGGRPKIEETVNRRGGICLMSGTPMPFPYIREEGKAGRMGSRLMAIVVESELGRMYVSPTEEMQAVALSARPTWKPDNTLPINPRDFKTPNYGLTTFADLFTSRQLVALTTFSDLVGKAREMAYCDGLAAGLPDDGHRLETGGIGAGAYADAVALYLGMAVSKMSDAQSSLCRWKASMDQSIATFGRQALPMVWDYSEANALGGMAGDYIVSLKNMMRVVDQLPCRSGGTACQADAQSQNLSDRKVVSTDPPYYDNIGYADLSDFFYVWLRHSLKPLFPDLFNTMAVPKAEELVATPYRHGGKDKAEKFFLDGMTQAMHRVAEQAHPAFPITIYYAFKQAESEGADGTASTGWETFLDAVIRAGLATTGTWPMRTELSNRMIGSGANALASSIILVCRPRSTDVPTATRREFLAALKAELPKALAHLQRGNIAPVDLAQAAIGPGMAVYTRYPQVLDAEGNTLSVREALALINQTLDETLAEQEGDFDADSRWALAWFGDHGFEEGPFGDAHTYFVRFNTAENALKSDGIIESGRSKVRLLKPNELSANWDPSTDLRLTAWKAVHQLVRLLEEGGESAAAALVAKLGGRAEVARELAYRLYAICERKKRAQEALSYNGLVQSWPEITRLARSGAQASQPALFDQE